MKGLPTVLLLTWMQQSVLVMKAGFFSDKMGTKTRKKKILALLNEIGT